MEADFAEFRQTFLDEARELIEEMEGHLLALERSPDDRALLDALFRCAHSLKGGSGVFGFNEMAQSTHALEDTFERLRQDRLNVDKGLTDGLLRSVDELRRMLVEGEPAAPSEAGANTRPSSPLLQDWAIRFEPDPRILQRGLDPLGILREVANAAEALDVAADLSGLPRLAEIDPEQCYLAWTIRARDATREALEDAFQFVGHDSKVRLTPAGQTSTFDGGGGAGRNLPTLRVASEKVDRLFDLVGELVIAQSIVAQLVSRFTPDRLGQLGAAVAQMDRHTRDLQERVMAVRMVPIQTLFSRLPRLVRDLCRVRGKEVRLEISGEETELDKKVLELMTDPLTHLVRNAVDHGIESPGARRRAGKPEAGYLRLHASQQSGMISIEVADDGAGLEREKIRARALELGLISSGDLLSDEEAVGLVFRPGFSTAAKITEVSGRGVGLDIVKRNVEALSGSITIQTEPGRGTSFGIKLPLTLAILEGQLVRVGNETYIVPLASIVESIRPTRESLRRVLGEGEAFLIRGQVLPMVRLSLIFGVEATIEDPTQGLVVVVEYEGRRVALLVDELGDQQQVVVKSLETNFQKLAGIAGATILGDGHVALILDVPELVLSPGTAGAITRRGAAHGRGVCGAR